MHRMKRAQVKRWTRAIFRAAIMHPAIFDEPNTPKAVPPKNWAETCRNFKADPIDFVLSIVLAFSVSMSSAYLLGRYIRSHYG
jgi:hypothetical protein